MRAWLISYYTSFAKEWSPRRQSYSVKEMRAFKRLWVSLVFSSFTAFEHELASIQKTYGFVPPPSKRAEKEGWGGSQKMDFFRLFYLWICTTHIKSESNKSRAMSSFSTGHYWRFDPLPMTVWNWEPHLTTTLFCCKHSRKSCSYCQDFPLRKGCHWKRE